MSLAEYRFCESETAVVVGTEWTELRLFSGFSLICLKQWVDNGGNEHGPHDVVLSVSSDIPSEFRLKTMGDYFRRSGFGSDDLMMPQRYINVVPIGFNRATVVYDPRAVVSSSPIMKLERIIGGVLHL